MILIFTEALESREHGDSSLCSQAALPRWRTLLPGRLLHGEEASHAARQEAEYRALTVWGTCIGQPHPKRGQSHPEARPWVWVWVRVLSRGVRGAAPHHAGSDTSCNCFPKRIQHQLTGSLYTKKRSPQTQPQNASKIPFFEVFPDETGPQHVPLPSSPHRRGQQRRKPAALGGEGKRVERGKQGEEEAAPEQRLRATENQSSTSFGVHKVVRFYSPDSQAQQPWGGARTRSLRCEVRPRGPLSRAHLP